jgi:DNA invertase Pin-like site-specific DNA recombinase
LGLEAQRTAVEAHCKAHGYRLIDEFIEIESGRKSDRPVLREALARARTSKATLLIARLDRLARNVAFISGLMESGVEFAACDLSPANRLMLHILAAVAEEEARRSPRARKPRSRLPKRAGFCLVRPIQYAAIG